MKQSIPVRSVDRYADDLVFLLVDAGPMTAQEACVNLGWPRGRFDTAVKYARTKLCPELGVAIPSPTPEDGWQYQVTTEWGPVEAGASYSLGIAESRLRGIQRDVELVFPALTPRSREWRRANFLRKHLAHMLGTLEEING